MPRKFVFIDQKNRIKYFAQLEKEPLCPNCPSRAFRAFSSQKFQGKFNFERSSLEIFCSRCGSLLVEIPLEKIGAEDGLFREDY